MPRVILEGKKFYFYLICLIIFCIFLGGLIHESVHIIFAFIVGKEFRIREVCFFGFEYNEKNPLLSSGGWVEIGFLNKTINYERYLKSSIIDEFIAISLEILFSLFFLMKIFKDFFSESYPYKKIKFFVKE